MNPLSSWAASVPKVSGQFTGTGLDLAGGDGGAGVCTTRSTIWMALRPDAAARSCSHERCRHVSEHHRGTRPRGLTTVG